MESALALHPTRNPKQGSEGRARNGGRGWTIARPRRRDTRRLCLARFQWGRTAALGGQPARSRIGSGRTLPAAIRKTTGARQGNSSGDLASEFVWGGEWSERMVAGVAAGGALSPLRRGPFGQSNEGITSNFGRALENH